MVAVVGVERKANKEVSELLLCDRPGRWGQGTTRDGTGWNRSISKGGDGLEALFDVLLTLSDVLKLALIFSAHGKVIVWRRKSH
jgi:hypothetical protein